MRKRNAQPENRERLCLTVDERTNVAENTKHTDEYSRMSDDELKEFISALADKDAAGLSSEQVEILQRVVHERPELLGEYQLNIATKLCLLKHARYVPCPDSTSESIRTIIYHVYKSRQASL